MLLLLRLPPRLLLHRARAIFLSIARVRMARIATAPRIHQLLQARIIRRNFPPSCSSACRPSRRRATRSCSMAVRIAISTVVDLTRTGSTRCTSDHRIVNTRHTIGRRTRIRSSMASILSSSTTTHTRTRNRLLSTRSRRTIRNRRITRSRHTPPV